METTTSSQLQLVLISGKVKKGCNSDDEWLEQLDWTTHMSDNVRAKYKWWNFFPNVEIFPTLERI